LIDAAREVFARHGPEAPVSVVAAAAGVGIASLYRRYATKQDLLQHLCLVSMEQQIAAASTALAAGDDDWANLSGYVRTCVGFRAGVFGIIAGTIPITAEMIATAAEAHRLVAELVQRAQASGTLRPDVNAVDLFELVALFSRRDSTSSTATQRLLEIALAGLRDGAPGTLPDQAITWGDYAAGWSFQDDGENEARQVPVASPRVSG
jgi:AcrR family transcriptional regulator